MVGNTTHKDIMQNMQLYITMKNTHFKAHQEMVLPNVKHEPSSPDDALCISCKND